jgi:hypothetical protein
MEVKLDLVSLFTDYMLYINVDDIIELLKVIVNESNQVKGVFVNNINPIMVAA